MKFSTDKKIEEFVEKLIDNGWVYSHGKKHGKLRHPCGKILIVSVSPSCSRAWKNFLHDV